MSTKKERNGQFTGDFGIHLREVIESNSRGKLEVHFDHGKEGSERIVAHMGQKSSRANALSFVDIAVVESDNIVASGLETGRVVLLCEIEEEGARPKKVIGNLCGILFADGVQIGDSHYHFDKTHLLLGVRCSERGKAIDKTKEIIVKVKGIANPELIGDVKGIYGCSYQELMESLEKAVVDIVRTTELRFGVEKDH